MACDDLGCGIMMENYLSAGRTEVGKVRRHNEDAILLRDDAGLWVVADGLGGHTAGDYASTLIVERLGALQRHGSIYDFMEAIEDSLEQVNADLRAAALARHVDVIGSTVVLLVYDSDFVLCGWAGDSRLYCYEDGHLRQVTTDHVQGTPDDVTRLGVDAQAAASAGALTRAIGAEDQLFIDWVAIGRRPNMQFLLCSDGLNKEVSDDELDHECRHHAEPQSLLTSLFDLALNRSARDNISAVAVRLQDK
jgi:protein phosphatase